MVSNLFENHSDGSTHFYEFLCTMVPRILPEPLGPGAVPGT